jgi:hypothetical protein
MEPGRKGLITKGALGSKRYEFIFSAQGGHSWSAFGKPNPIHALALATAKMARVEVPEAPRTSYKVDSLSAIQEMIYRTARQCRCGLFPFCVRKKTPS